jgi:hypothetical protein
LGLGDRPTPACAVERRRWREMQNPRGCEITKVRTARSHLNGRRPSPAQRSSTYENNRTASITRRWFDRGWHVCGGVRVEKGSSERAGRPDRAAVATTQLGFIGGKPAISRAQAKGCPIFFHYFSSIDSSLWEVIHWI